jgi:hypothetical protein
MLDQRVNKASNSAGGDLAADAIGLAQQQRQVEIDVSASREWCDPQASGAQKGAPTSPEN